MRTGRPRKYPQLVESYLREKYLTQEMSVPEISRLCNVPVNTIRHYLPRFGIEQRNSSEARRISIKRGIIKGVQLKLSGDELRELYWGQNYTLADIAKQVGCCTDRVKREMLKLGIPRRSVSDASKLCFLKGRRGNGRFRDNRDGYVFILKHEHPLADNRGYVREHILIWEQANNKPLPDKWIVHHLNGIKDDNRLENLLAMPRKDHNSQLQLDTMRQRIRDLETKLGY